MPGSLDSTLDGILAVFGVSKLDEQADVRAALQNVLDSHDVTANIDSIRWGKVTISADAVNAAKAQWHTDALTAAARRASDGNVECVRIVVERPRGQHS